MTEVRAFEFGERFVSAHRLGGLHLLLRYAGADDVDAIERRFRGDFLAAQPMELKAVVLNGERQELG